MMKHTTLLMTAALFLTLAPQKSEASFAEDLAWCRQFVGALADLRAAFPVSPSLLRESYKESGLPLVTLPIPENITTKEIKAVFGRRGKGSSVIFGARFLLTPAERERYKVYAHNGYLYESNGTLYEPRTTVKEGYERFLMDVYGNIYVNLDIQLLYPPYERVAAVGGIEIRGGKIKRLDFSPSSHVFWYPSAPESEQQIRARLLELGIASPK